MNVYVCLCVISDNQDFECFKEDYVIFPLQDNPLKLVNNFACLGSNISSAEVDSNIRIGRDNISIENLIFLNE